MKNEMGENIESLDLTWRDCMQILSAIKAIRYKIQKQQKANQRKGRLPEEGRADVNLIRLEYYDGLFERVLKITRILEKRYKQEQK